MAAVHLDHGSWENRRSAERVAAFAAGRIAGGERVIPAGDLDARAGGRTPGIPEAAGLRFAPVPGATFHPERGLDLFGAIDRVGPGPGPATALRGARASRTIARSTTGFP